MEDDKRLLRLVADSKKNKNSRLMKKLTRSATGTSCGSSPNQTTTMSGTGSGSGPGSGSAVGSLSHIIPSEEQENIIEAHKIGHIVIKAVSGAGKTMTSLLVADSCRDDILMLTYNRRLCDETMDRVSLLGLENRVIVMTYHACARRFYGGQGFNDHMVRNVTFSSRQPVDLPKFDTVILDELQDMTDVLYGFAIRLITDISHIRDGREPKLILLGDPRQAIYEYNNADSRYLTMAKHVFPSKQLPWSKEKLSHSFRVPLPVVEFINKCVYRGRTVMHSEKKGAKPVYFYWSNKIIDKPAVRAAKEAGVDPDGVPKLCNLAEIIEQIITSGINPNETFILAPSIRTSTYSRKKNPIISAIDALTNKFPIYRPSSDDSNLSHEQAAGKIIFSSFHQSKGLERDNVILLGFDQTYEAYYNRDGDPYMCSNAMYVALTRAKKRLFILQNEHRPVLSCLRERQIDKTCVVGPKYKGNITPAETKDVPRAVTSFVRHVSLSIEDHCMLLLDVKELESKGEIINVPSEVTSIWEGRKTVKEEISDITGNTCPLMYRVFRDGVSDIREYFGDEVFGVASTLKRLEGAHNQTIKKYVNSFIMSIGNRPTNENMLKAGFLVGLNMDCWQAHRIKQIQEFSWLTNEARTKICDRIHKFVGRLDGTFEYDATIDIDELPCMLKGKIDFVSPEILYEFKFVDNISSSHIFQLAMYELADKLKTVRAIRNDMKGFDEALPTDTYSDVEKYYPQGFRRRYLLANNKTGEVLELSNKIDNLIKVANYINDNQWKSVDDEDKKFLDNAKIIRRKISKVVVKN
jgi:hypothetical protein